jgi:hypothetical protein
MVNVVDLAKHNEFCEDYIYYRTHCDECDKLKPGASGSVPKSKRCTCAEDQDSLNQDDLPYRRR